MELAKHILNYCNVDDIVNLGTGLKMIGNSATLCLKHVL